MCLCTYVRVLCICARASSSNQRKFHSKNYSFLQNKSMKYFKFYCCFNFHEHFRIFVHEYEICMGIFKGENLLFNILVVLT